MGLWGLSPWGLSGWGSQDLSECRIVNVNPPLRPVGINILLPFSFRVECPHVISIIGVAVQYVRDKLPYVVYETDGFTERYAPNSTVSGVGTPQVDFTLFEFGGWRGRLRNVLVYGIGANGEKFIFDVLDESASEIIAPPVSPVVPFVWSGAFDILPQNPSEARIFLGTNGDLTEDIGDDSHFFRLDTGGVIDGGTLRVAPTGSDLFTVASATSVADPDYELGLVDVASITSGALRDYGSVEVPSAMDGTKSYLGCVLFTPNSDNDGGSTNRSVYHNYDNGEANGWYLWFQNNGAADGIGRKMIFTQNWTVGAGQSVGSSFIFNYDEPMMVMWEVDYSASKFKLIVAQGENLQYNEAAFTNTGSFHADLGKSFGDPIIISGWEACSGSYGLGFTFEWNAALASGITEANVERFLKYSNGVLP